MEIDASINACDDIAAAVCENAATDVDVASSPVALDEDVTCGLGNATGNIPKGIVGRTFLDIVGFELAVIKHWIIPCRLKSRDNDEHLQPPSADVGRRDISLVRGKRSLGLDHSQIVRKNQAVFKSYVRAFSPKMTIL